jgi:hypothetical protein
MKRRLLPTTSTRSSTAATKRGCGACGASSLHDTSSPKAGAQKIWSCGCWSGGRSSPKDHDIPADKFPAILETVNVFKRGVLQKAHDCDGDFLRRLSDAAKLITKGEIPESLDSNLTFTGYALIAWAHLCGELGHRPNRHQLRKRVERLGKEDGENLRIGDRQWDNVVGDLRRLFPGGG